jgi:hypothetical protein
MIKVNELRIGNIIEDIFDKKNPIIRQVDLDDFVMMNNYSNHPLPFRPVLITNKLLLDSLFNESRWKWILLSTDAEKLQVTEDGRVLIYNNQDDFICLVVIKYFHQLQNLWFSLTGKELTIKL